MRWLARLRLVNARRPWVRWCLVGALALTVAAGVTQRVTDLDDRRRAWGEVVPVVVAARDLAPGDVVSDTDVTIDDRPVAVIPAGSLHDLSALGTGTRTWQWVAAGEVLVAHDLAGVASSAERLPPRTRGVVVASGGLPVAVGDVLEIVMDGERLTTASVVELLPVASGFGTRDPSSVPVLVAVPTAAAPMVAAAVAEGRATVVLSDARSQRQPAASTTAITRAKPTR